MDNRTLEGRFAVVTGGSRGIGRAISDCLAAAGCNVALGSRNADDCRAAAGEIASRHGVKGFAARCDVSNIDSVGEFFDGVERWSSGRLDALVCNAGFPLDDALWNTPLHETPDACVTRWYMDVFATDALGSVLCTRRALRTMIEARRGSIVYISSTPALEGYRGAPYTMAKSAILGLSKEVAIEYGPSGIRANALALGNIATAPTLAQMGPGLAEELAAETPLRRWGRPEEVAQAVRYLLSDESSFITGQTIVLDGGNVRW